MPGSRASAQRGRTVQPRIYAGDTEEVAAKISEAVAETIAAVISAVGKTGAAATRVATVVTTSRLVMTNVVVPTGTKTNALGRGRAAGGGR